MIIRKVKDGCVRINNLYYKPVNATVNDGEQLRFLRDVNMVYVFQLNNYFEILRPWEVCLNNLKIER